MTPSPSTLGQDAELIEQLLQLRGRIGIPTALKGAQLAYAETVINQTIEQLKSRQPHVTLTEAEKKYLAEVDELIERNVRDPIPPEYVRTLRSIIDRLCLTKAEAPERFRKATHMSPYKNEGDKR